MQDTMRQSNSAQRGVWTPALRVRVAEMEEEESETMQKEV